MGRAPCCEKSGLKKGPWTPEEDEKLVAYIKKHGQGNWRTLPKNAAIAARLPGRTDNEIKNYWNTHIRKRLLRMGIDPVTHAPRLDLLDLSALLKPAAYYPTQADLDTLRAFEPLASYPDLLRLASALLSGGSPAAPTTIGDQQQLLPWLLQAQMAQAAAGMAQQAAVAPPQQADHQFMQQQQQAAGAACQMPDLVHATSPTLAQQLAAAAQQQHHQAQDMAAVACDSMQPPTCYVDSLDVPALMQMVQQPDASNLQQWSSTVTSSNNNNVGSGVSTPSSSPVAGLNHSASTVTTYGGASASSDAAALFSMQLSELLDVSDYM
ncbi:hypothetical protein BAE44_0003565 [Dichanthelium oligosanthes]|uniref:Uncharacterized protein n=1 Tax=Dichanthelium oligosanthes TaxID=888268 RepID=A0A1E5WDE7_9POAL|nr:hypothetical protein BAE44_0003565 [Dichanthelium oligosanthes]